MRRLTADGPAIGFTSFDQRQPGWKTIRPTCPPPTFRISALALRELAGLVGCLEAFVLGCLSMYALQRCRVTQVYLLTDRSESDLLVGQASRVWRALYRSPGACAMMPARPRGSWTWPSGWSRPAGSTASATPTSQPSCRSVRPPSTLLRQRPQEQSLGARPPARSVSSARRPVRRAWPRPRPPDPAGRSTSRASRSCGPSRSRSSGTPRSRARTGGSCTGRSGRCRTRAPRRP